MRMGQSDLVIVEPIIERLVARIAEENGIPPLEAIDRFYNSETYGMLTDPELYLWDLSDKALYDVWLAEQNTGNPRNSEYI